MQRLGTMLRLAVLGTCAATASAAQAQSWTAMQVPIGSMALNNLGQVAGATGKVVFYTAPNSPNEIDLYQPGGGTAQFSVAINNLGQVGGTYQPLIGSVPGYFVTGPNASGLVFTAYYGMVFGGLNDAGQLAGSAYDLSSGIEQVFLTGPNGQSVNVLGALSTTPALGHVAGVNDSGQVVGTRVVVAPTGNALDNVSQAFITGPNGQGMYDVGNLGGGQSLATAVNASGQVVGWALSTNGQYDAFLTGANGQGVTNLGGLGGLDGDLASVALGVNASGQVVGYAYTSNGHSDAFVTGAQGQGMVDLNSLVTLADGSYLQTALAINDVGQILAKGADGMSYLITPVPEPATTTFMGLGFGCLAALSLLRRLGWP